ncbi:hypothetical protein IW150_004655 [Coemansia sp. RSA 2607]|nr:hypothetical protein IW150_004655 [Coemansia sp. RSA 2607]
MLHRYNKRKAQQPRRSPSPSEDASLCTVKMSFVDDYLKDPSAYSRALNNRRATPYARPPMRSPETTTSTPSQIPATLPTFEIKVVQEPSSGQMVARRSSMEEVFRRIFSQQPPKLLKPPKPPNPTPIKSSATSTNCQEACTQGDFSDITCMRPSVNTCNIRWAKAPPMDISQYPLAHTLSPAEQECCSNLRLLPEQYIEVKITLIRAGRTYPHGSFKKRDAQKLCRIDVNKTSKVFEWFVKLNWIPNTLCRNLNKIC